MSTPPTRASQSAARRSTKRTPARKGWRRFFSWKKILLTMLGLFLLGFGAFAVAYASTDIPQPNELANAQASIVYYADGKTEMARISVNGGNRESVPLTKIPVHVQKALLAAEDRTFYTNNGISPSGIARAVKSAVTGGPTQGGSTITQQYVKNYFLTQDQTISRKAKEFIISLKIDQQESKDTILANYLNTIYYGRGAYGIQTAAKAYFGHDASKLTVAEGALLASVIRGPAFYDPVLGAEQLTNAKGRVEYVLDGMVSQGWLSAEVRAKATFPKVLPRAKVTGGGGTVGYITEEVRRELKAKLNLTDTDIDRGGLRIVSTIVKKAQDSAVRAVADHLPSEKEAKNLHVGLTAIKPGDGAVVAMYGGKNYTGDANTSTVSTMPAGSTFKVFGLLAAGQKDISTKTRFDGNSPKFFPEFVGPGKPRGEVTNFGDNDYGRVDLREATGHSVNTVFAKLNIDLADSRGKASAVRDAAILAGLPKACPVEKKVAANGKVSYVTKYARTCTPGLGIEMTNILGTASPHVIDMANAYATIAAQGQKATPYLIARVTSVDGGINYKVKKELSAAFDKDVTADVTEAMTHVLTDGTATSGTRGLDRPAAGKTGTSEENKAVWFDGFTPQLAAAVGIFQGKGTDTIKVNNRDLGEVTGAGYPVDIWTAFMKGALQGEKVIQFPKRAGLGDDSLPTATTAPPTTTMPPTTTVPPTTIPPTTVPPTTVPPTKGPPTTGPPITLGGGGGAPSP